MAVTYTYDFSGGGGLPDFTSLDPSRLGVPNASTLPQEIIDAGLTVPALLSTDVVTGLDFCDVTFAAALSAGQITTLTGVINAHTGLPPGTGDTGDGDHLTSNSYREEQYVATGGQITFLLPTPPEIERSVNFIVNGTDYEQGVDFTVSGQTITWTDVKFTIEADDYILIRYFEEL